MDAPHGQHLVLDPNGFLVSVELAPGRWVSVRLSPGEETVFRRIIGEALAP